MPIKKHTSYSALSLLLPISENKLLTAVKENNFSKIEKFIIKYHLDTDTDDLSRIEMMKNAICDMAGQGNKKLLGKLQGNYLNVFKKCLSGDALYRATKNGHLDVVDSLLKNLGRSQKNQIIGAALIQATKMNNQQIFIDLIANVNVDFASIKENNKDLFDVACQYNASEIKQYLIDFGCGKEENVNVETRDNVVVPLESIQSTNPFISIRSSYQLFTHAPTFQERLERINKTNEVPEHLQDIFSGNCAIINDPIKSPTGFIFDRTSLRNYFIQKGQLPGSINCPYSGNLISDAILGFETDQAFKKTLEDYVSKCEHNYDKTRHASPFYL